MRSTTRRACGCAIIRSRSTSCFRGCRARRDACFIIPRMGSTDLAAATASLQASLKRLKTDHVDLMQAWNVGEENYDLGVLREWKAQKLCRYIGMTTSFSGQYSAIAKVLAREKPDFFQVNYSLA